MVYVFLADGFEELEAIAPIDMMRRAGLTVVTVGVGRETVRSSHGVEIHADITDSQIALDEKVQAVMLPGGMPGTVNLFESRAVHDALDYCKEKGLLIAAICAAPSILGRRGMLRGKEAICFPGFEKYLTSAKLSNKYVVADGNIITARGAGVAVEFGLKIVEMLCGSEKTVEIREAIQCKY
ncbi:MAG: DJ-1 family glyoxalase III [Oscillospiraceae bacterium]